MSDTTTVRSRPSTTADDEILPPLASAVVGIIAVAFVALELAVSARYGFHRDELYFLACARHLTWGFVDQPPFVPAVAWAASHLLGTTPTALRLLPALAGGAAVVITALTARELAGGRVAQMLAALAAATSPQFLGAFHLLSTAPFDMFFWSALTFLVLRFLRTGDERLWPAIGVVAGVALLNKWNVAFLLAALTAGLLLGGRRDVLRTRGFWTAAGIAFVLWLPNLVWNAGHDWAAISMTHNLHAENGGLGPSLQFIPSQVFVAGPVLVVFWVAGLRHLLRSTIARPLGLTYLVLLVFFTLTGGKSYYLAGMYFALFAAGGVWAERRLQRKGSPPRGWIALMLVGALAALPLAIPVLPASALPKGSAAGNINKDLSATLGWQPFVAQVARVAATLPPDERERLVVFTGDYGAAGAIDLYGARYGLPHALSGHNSYWWWGPGDAPDGSTTVAVNLSRGYLLTIFSDVSLAGRVTTPHGVWSEERGDPIWICRGQRQSWAAAWPAARHYG
jgi:4-amino-4-deoxy-L-arabinose transferase-like glycosyltransferase